jgi:hypothetical protein
MARPNSMKTDNPANVRMPPMIHKKSETPTEPETAKIPDGVEKTVTLVSYLLLWLGGSTYYQYRSSCLR